MTIQKSLIGAAIALALAGTTQAATIVNLDALTPAATDVTLAAGTYNISVVDGMYDGYSMWYHVVPYFEAFEVSFLGTSVAYDASVPGLNRFTNYASTADALAAFQHGPYAVYGSDKRGYNADNTAPLYTVPTMTFTLPVATTVSFSIPDDYFADNSGGVSLSITAAVPEPETYALMLAGLGAVGFITMRRRVH